jgi:hypothetical protein
VRVIGSTSKAPGLSLAAGPEFVKRRGVPLAGSIPQALDMFRSEVRFYREIAPEVGVRVPACYRTEVTDDGTLLVLEDMSAWQPGADPAGAARLRDLGDRLLGNAGASERAVGRAGPLTLAQASHPCCRPWPCKGCSGTLTHRTDPPPGWHGLPGSRRPTATSPHSHPGGGGSPRSSWSPRSDRRPGRTPAPSGPKWR